MVADTVPIVEGRSGRGWRLLLLACTVVRTDRWWWDEPAWIAGIPASLAYHAGFCLLLTVVLAVAVHHAWPAVSSVDR